MLVTGANHGIGAATAKAFAEEGAQVFVAYFRKPCPYSGEVLEKARCMGRGGPELYFAGQQATADGVISHIRTQGGKAAALEADLGDSAVIPQLFDQCESELGPVDILVNNHTHCVLETFDPDKVTSDGFPVSLPTAESIDAHFAINARAYALMMAEYFQRFLKRRAQVGRVVNISTDAAHAHAQNLSYAASKHAIESYSRSAALEMGRYGITVNVVAPGPTQTGYITPESEAALAAGTPLRRIGRPEDIAQVIVFLASAQAHWLTGQLLYAGGGWRIPL